MKDLNKYIEETNGIIRMEAERILNEMKRTGLELKEREHSINYIMMMVESTGNKIGITIMLNDEDIDDKLQTMIIDGFHISYKILLILNGMSVKVPDKGRADFIEKMAALETVYCKGIMDVVEQLKNYEE